MHDPKADDTGAFAMARHPTQLVSEYLTGDPAILREARRRLTLTDDPPNLRDRIARAMRRPEQRGYAAIHNERMIRTHAQLGALRLALVQWAAQCAPRDIGGFHALLMWALARVDWSVVTHCVAIQPQQSVRRSAMTPHLAK
jgi:hypothetical protein